MADSQRHVLLAAEGYCAVQGVRLEPEAVKGALTCVRDFMRTHGAAIGSWWLSDRSTPPDVEERLIAAGLRRVRGDYELDGMILLREPPHARADVEARPVRTADEYAAARLLQYDVFDSPAVHRRTRDELVAEFEAGAPGITYAAWVDDRLAAAARAFFAPQGATLAGGTTLPWARGRGCYRALVRARWDDVSARGSRALVVQAGAMSAPILRRLGFETVHHFRRLEDVLPRA